VYIGMSLTFFTVMSVFALLIFRRRHGWKRLPALNIAYPLVPVLYIAIGVCMMGYGFVSNPLPSLTAFATVGAGALVYHFRIR
jgi:hypothetical protein